MNEGSETCRFLQLWITPDRKGHTPQYGSSTYKDSDRLDKLLLILRGTSEPPAFPVSVEPVRGTSDAPSPPPLPPPPPRPYRWRCAGAGQLGQR